MTIDRRGKRAIGNFLRSRRRADPEAADRLLKRALYGRRTPPRPRRREP